MAQDVHFNNGCGSFIFDNQRIMVVTGGLKSSTIGLTSVELYVEGSNADNWPEGPTLPETYSFGQHIVSDDFSLYYINTWENKLRRLNCVRPTECQ